MCGSFLVLFTKVYNGGDFGEDIILTGESNFDIRGSTEVRVSHHLSSGFLDESEEFGLNAEGVHLDLEDSGLNLAVLKDFSELLELEVGTTNVFGETGLLASFHGVVGLLVSDTFSECKLGFFFSFPARGVSDLRVNVLESYGEVDEVQIDIIETKVL